MSTLTAAFYRGRQSGQVSSRFLAWWQRCDYSHVERVLWRVGRWAWCGSASLRDKGVRCKLIYLDPELWELWEIEHPVFEQHRGFEWFEAHDGQRYDLLGLLGFVVRRIKGWLKRWWCSEAVAASAGLHDPWRWDVAMLAALFKTFGRPLPLDETQKDSETIQIA